MKIIEVKDIVEFVKEGEVLAVTTNGIVKKDGSLVMGAGIAKQVNDVTNGQCAKILGSYVSQYGNRAFNIGVFNYNNKKVNLASFPTKQHYKDNSDIELIKKSAIEIKEMADKFNWKRVYIPFPGIGCGNLDEGLVHQSLKNLDDRFVLVKRLKTDYGVSKGTLTICSLSQLKDYNTDTYAIKELIVRSAKDELIESMNKHGVKLNSALSPSPELFTNYLRWKDGKFSDNEKQVVDTSDPDAWWELYTNMFLAEMFKRDDLVNALHKLQGDLDKGLDALLVCYCKDFKKCHRVLIGYYMLQRGYTVNFK